MPLRLYNTLTRQKEEFQPLDKERVRMYVCGPTVYDFAHIGNARPVIVFDVLFRLLRHLYGESHVTYVRNITDVDDKINARALRDFPDLPLNDAIRNVTEKTASQFFADVKALGCLDPTVQPRATDNIPGMIEMIRALIARGHAYQAGSEVLFSVPSMPDYGALSQRRLEDQQAGARVAVDAHKRDAADFVLWKLSSPEEPGWDSPWGRGRPGWHIECSAMSSRYLGEVFDIHGGGLDLIFPHHENEIAQSRCAFGTSVMARTWMHNGFLQVEGQKMSKSLGNFVTINDVLQEWPGEFARYSMLLTHYRQPIDWTRSKLIEARSSLQKFQKWYVPLEIGFSADYDQSAVDVEVLESLQDDLSTPEAFSALHRLATDLANPALQSRPDHNKRLSEFSRSLDLLGLAPRKQLVDIDATRVDAFISARLEARKAKNWAESDRIRDELAAMGIAIKDNKDGTTSWEVKR
ncbi:cysteine--tRNA ligase [Aestuariivirga sp.]|uniref:cysteine--tRNA ligase n=1 Tax=Aestuariivirga sp. TaxID=2650926 RepID=UPI0039E44427